jgi:hypothetical protein
VFRVIVKPLRERYPSNRISCAYYGQPATELKSQFDDKQLTGIGIIEDSVNDAVRRCVEASGEQSVAVIPEGPYVVPAFRPEA